MTAPERKGKRNEFPVCCVLFSPSIWHLIHLFSTVGLPSNKIKIHSLALERGVSGLSVATAFMEPACLLPCSSLGTLENRACVEWIRRSELGVCVCMG